MMKDETKWPIFRGDYQPHDRVKELPEPPPWRVFHGKPIDRLLPVATLKAKFEVEANEVALINTALFLRRPLLITGKPGTGKSTLAHAVAHELQLGPVLTWPINTRSTLQEGLYRYDAIGRAQDGASAADIGKYLKLGPMGTALLPSLRPRVLLIDEIDKSDIDLPNDLLNVFEEGTFEVPELSRLAISKVWISTHDIGVADIADQVEIERGRVTCRAFPFVVLTSNNERDFPPPFLRRCIRLEMGVPDSKKLARVVSAHFDQKTAQDANGLIQDFLRRQGEGKEALATDQLLNAVYMSMHHNLQPSELLDAIFRILR